VDDALNYYAVHSPLTDPEAFRRVYDDLPPTVPELAAVVQGLLLHYREGEMYKVVVSSERTARDEAREVSTMLRKLLEHDDRSLTQARTPDRRLVGCCRDFALLLCSLLRHQGVPARVRFGFSLYFTPHFGCDHVVTEYWDRVSARWVLVDPQQDTLHREMNALRFDPHDVPRDWFLTADRAWQLARGALIDERQFGYDRSYAGRWVLQQYLVHDVAALNNRELLIGDSWGLARTRPDQEATSDEVKVLDEAARLIQQPDPWGLRAFYASQPGLKVPNVIASSSLTHVSSTVELVLE
jgi:hypothetical protein